MLYPLRPVETAEVRFTTAPHHRRRVTIDHRPLANVKPAMLLNWFTHIGETMPHGGEVIDRYLAWHPIDLIHWELASPAPGGGAAEGARFRMVEAFGGLDEIGIRLVQRIAGVVVFELEHTWSTGSDGAHYVTVLDIGARSALLAPINRYLCRRLPDEMMRARVVGQLEHLLPQTGIVR